MSLIDYLTNSDTVVLYDNGTKKELDKSTLLPQLELLTDKAYFSPALAVVKNSDILSKISKGYWLEFCYKDVRKYADMEFDKLLIEIKPDMYGFNLIRGISNEYSGRCFYLNLNVDTTRFYKFLKELA